jgi:hypothetical protein
VPSAWLRPSEPTGALKIRFIGFYYVAFREDDCRIRNGNAPENFTLLRHLAVSALNQEKTAKVGIKNKRLRAGWDDDYLLKVLAG